MQALPTRDDPNLIVGPEHFSDAGVYRVGPDTAMVQTVDFFSPLVDDPFVFGQIAAANALSDAYAMGARPVTALNIVCFPDDRLSLDVLERILAGGAERVHAAGAVVLGGHSVRDAEIKYGLCVTGLVDPEKLMRNDAAQPGDALVLTKGLGTGFITTAYRAKSCPADVLDAACASMSALNRAASEAAVEVGARAATDVTGFGFAVHALEMARASSVAFDIDLDRLPLLPGARALAERGRYRTRANPTNERHAAPDLERSGGLDPDLEAFLFDPQTSGGLLIAVPSEHAARLVERCHASGLGLAAEIGRVRAAGEGPALTVRSGS